MHFELDEVRRLTGPNLLSDEAGAIADVFFDSEDAMSVVQCWQKHIERCQSSLGDEARWPYTTYARLYVGGASVSISAPMDLLYSACDLLELAWELCVEEMCSQALSLEQPYAQKQGYIGQPSSPIDQQGRLAELKHTILAEKKPDLITIINLAQLHNVTCLADDEVISLGMGSSLQVWPIDELPDIADIDWRRYQKVPLALITGTNGKSTSVRLAAEIAKAAGLSAGITSTDFIKVGDTVIDKGDYSGPGGARMLLRDKRTEIAFLEVARGGLLRRGLPVSIADACLVTNAASDHLGQYGINTVDEIADVKMMVAKAINTSGTLVLNADDKRLAALGNNLDKPICWFSRDKSNANIVRAIATQQPCVYTHQDEFVYHHKAPISIAKISAVPMTVGGNALHNIENACGVIGLCKAIGISDFAIKTGLMHFASSAKDNPGRGNLYKLNGISIVVDFAHNSHSMQAVLNMAASMPAKRKHIMFSHAGDRSDSAIVEVTEAVRQFAPDTFVLAEIEQYLRGRTLGDVSSIVRAYLISMNVPKQSILLTDTPLEGAKQLIQKANEGDLILMFVLSERDKVQAYLESLQQGIK